MEEVKELRVVVRMRNNRLLKMREERKLTQPQAAEKIGISMGILRDYEALVRSPIDEDGGWKEDALKICCFYAAQPDWLWTNTVLSVRKSLAMREVSAREAQMLLQAEPTPAPQLVEDTDELRHLLELVQQLPKEEREVLERKFGLNGRNEELLDEIGQHVPGAWGGTSRERARQRVEQALSRLRTLL